MLKSREIMVGRRGEAPLVPPYKLPSFKRALALTDFTRLANSSPLRSGAKWLSAAAP